ncbi:MAG TPA: protein kinase [Vicinamibacterales bacterium]|nr:protein kinase [Vicinamibacterales bacterium]
MIGRAISHYRVLSALGSGGMGIVYLAEDERLGRQVALKFLPADSAKNRQALDRFRVEARAASSLSHPGICAIFDIGDDEGTPFIVMEALRGENLRDRINKGPLKIGDIVEIGIQLADALEAAHTQGIIHRDIKPSNIFVGDKNRTKILDFGLAKLASGPGGPSGDKARSVDASTQQTIVKQLTLPGSALGTVSYMSPEQARGEEVDTRTDLFSLGAVLYEMATGTQAFGGSTPAVVFDAILNHTPPVMLNLNPLVPPRLEAIITTLLEKDRDLRYQHASDLQAELRRLKRDLDSGTMMGVSAARAGASAASPSSQRPPSAAQATPAPPKSAGMWRYAIAVLALLIAGAVGFTIWSGRRSEPTTSIAQRVDVPQSATTPAAPLPQQGDQVPPSPAPAPGNPPAPTTTAPAAPPSSATTPSQTEGSGRSNAPPRSTPEPRPPAPTPRGTTPPAPVTVAPTTPPPAQPSPTPQPSPSQTSPQTQTPAPSPTPPPPPAPTTAPVEPPAVAAPPAQPAPPRAADTTPPVQPAPQPTPRAAAPPPDTPPASPVESDDAAIRRVINTYKTAIEKKNVDLFRSVRPGLSSADEARLRDSFRQVDSQQITLVVEEIHVDGRTATARLSRQDVIVNGGRRETQARRQQTLRFEKSAAGWIITAIGG